MSIALQRQWRMSRHSHSEEISMFTSLPRVRALLAAGFLAATFATASAEAAPISNASFGLAGAFSVESGAHLGNNDSIYIENGGNIWVTMGDTMDLAGLVTTGMTGTMEDIP